MSGKFHDMHKYKEALNEPYRPFFLVLKMRKSSLEHQVKPVRQKYTRLSHTKYRYENVPNDFEAKIEVDEFGFVVDYPGLFVRTASLKTNYR